MSTTTGPGRPVRGDIERLVQHARAGRSTSLHQVIVLGAGRVMPTVSHSWKASVPIRCVGTWPVRHDQRDRIHQRVGEPGDRIGGAGAGGDQHARRRLPVRAGIAFGGMDRALLVAHQEWRMRVLLEQRVIDRQHRAARIAENDLDALVLQRAQEHFGARSGLRRAMAGHLLRRRHNRGPCCGNRGGAV